ncbi:MAG: hydroxymethylbilane synthase [Myxococcota bacterium]|nr:hydroxymethylbilane synthase [Myxococcota bacterium]
MKQPVRIATRGSELAVAQSSFVAERIQAAIGAPTELVIVRTEGDRILDRPLAEIGGKGLFVKEVEQALLDDRADVAIHSAKDLPADLAPGLVAAAFPAREDFRDALVGRSADARLDGLRPKARVGTGSVRRTSLLRSLRPDLEVVPLRGNVGTRLRKLEEEDLDAVILATAGLLRLGLADRIHERLDPDVFLPAATQGTLCVEARADDPLADALAAIGDPATRTQALAERGFLARLEGDCKAPIAALCEPASGGRIRLRGRLLSADGARSVAAEAFAAPEEAEALGRSVAEDLLSQGGEAILAELAAS